MKLLYVAPETLLTPHILSLLDSIQVDCLTIDKAHCISEWGHDFRHEFRQMVEAHKLTQKYLNSPIDNATILEDKCSSE